MWTTSRAQVSQGDQSIIFRVVGFLEYGAALHYLDQLVALASQEELSAIDQIIQSRSEFAIDPNAIRQRSTDTSSSQANSGQAVERFDRHGLAWMLAFARMEYGAMLATFTANPAPFVAAKPTRFEFSAYRELLMEGSQSHYWALDRDPRLGPVSRSAPGQEMLAYIRRLNLALHFLHAAAHSQANEIHLDQAALLGQQVRRLNDLYDAFRAVVAAQVAAQNFTKTSSRQWTNEWLVACCDLLAGARRELEMGTARVEFFPRN